MTASSTGTEDAPGTPVDDAPVPSSAADGRRAPRWLLAALSVLVLALVVAAVVLGLRVRGAEAREDDRDAALTAARQSALNLTSIDRADLEGDLARVLEGATGAFAEEFEARSENLRQVLVENEVVSEGEVIAAGLVRGDPTTATAIVVVDATVRNTAMPEGRLNTYRMRIELEKQGDRWLTSMLDFVG